MNARRAASVEEGIRLVARAFSEGAPWRDLRAYSITTGLVTVLLLWIASLGARLIRLSAPGHASPRSESQPRGRWSSCVRRAAGHAQCPAPPLLPFFLHQSSWSAFDHAAVSTWVDGLRLRAVWAWFGTLSAGSVTSSSCRVTDLPATPLQPGWLSQSGGRAHLRMVIQMAA